MPSTSCPDIVQVLELGDVFVIAGEKRTFSPPSSASELANMFEFVVSVISILFAWISALFAVVHVNVLVPLIGSPTINGLVTFNANAEKF